MSQFDYGTIDPDTKSGTALAGDLGNFRDALHSTHSGTSRPSYAAAGLLWLDTTADPAILKYYDGADDIPLAYLLASGNLLMLPSVTRIADTTDKTKRATFLLSGITAGQTRVLTIPNFDGTLATLAGTETFTNKTLTTPTLTLKQSGGAAPTAAGELQFDTTTNYLKAGDGSGTKAFPPGAWEHISTQTPSAAASVAWTNLSAFRALRITGFLKPGTDNQGIGIRTSTNNGSSYDASTGYSNQDIYGVSTTVAALLGTTDSAALLYASDAIGNATEEGVAFAVNVEQFNQSTFCWFLVQALFKNQAGSIYYTSKGAFRASATTRDAIQILAFSGNITGRVTLEGIRG